MKTNQIALAVAVLTTCSFFSCARKEPPVVVQQQPETTPVAVATAPALAPAPVRESSWKPAPVRGSQSKQVRPPVALPAEPAPIAAPTPIAVAPAVAPAPAPTPAPAPVVAERKPVAPPPPPAQPMKVTLAEGSILPVRISETLTSEKNENGDSWTGVLAEPLVINGLVIAERGSRVEGRVTDLTRAGRVKGNASISLALTRFHTADGQRIAVQTASFSRVAESEKKRDAGKIAIATGIGAAIGAIAGGGKGAGIGAGTGAAAGTGAVLITRGGPAVIATETLVRFRVEEPVTITEKLLK